MIHAVRKTSPVLGVDNVGPDLDGGRALGGRTDLEKGKERKEEEKGKAFQAQGIASAKALGWNEQVI